MDLFSELTVERGDIKVTLNGWRPTKGHLREVFEVDIKGLPVFKISLNDADLPVIINRNTFCAAVNQVLNEVWLTFDTPGDPMSREVHAKIQEYQREVKSRQNGLLDAEVVAYANRLKHTYMHNEAFKWGKRSLGVLLSVRRPHNAQIRFKPIRPGHYEVHFTFNCVGFKSGDQKKIAFSYDRSYPIENTEYLRKQLNEWLTITNANNKLEKVSYQALRSTVFNQFDILEPLIKDALVNLNEGNNL